MLFDLHVHLSIEGCHIALARTQSGIHVRLRICTKGRSLTRLKPVWSSSERKVATMEQGFSITRFTWPRYSADMLVLDPRYARLLKLTHFYPDISRCTIKYFMSSIHIYMYILTFKILR